ncbi:alpha/beta-hydrolase [Thozetella sp. PMI_491]|nr:alpha/beta-hydrolase [Thozetella sp. PMI_491]
MTGQPTNNAYLAQPPSDCCAKGSLHAGETRGSFETLAGAKTYISRPTEAKANGNIILYFPDVWAFANNALLMMDRYADAGYLVLGIDYLKGDTIINYKAENGDFVEGFDFQAWLGKLLPVAMDMTPSWIEAVKAKYGKADTKYACAGYCFGAPFVADLLANGGCDAGAFAHPAFLKDHHFSNLKKPLFLSCAEIDPTFGWESRRTALDILNKENKIYHVQLFQGVQHGFAVRCNLDNPYERWTREQSHAAITSWFDFWLSQ